MNNEEEKDRPDFLPAKAPEATLIETAGEARAAAAKASIEAGYAIAARFPRNLLDVRTRVLDACRRTKFAEAATYLKPVGGGAKVKGPSIRFAEEAIREMGHIRVDVNTTFEDADQRKVQVVVTDLQSNASYGQEISVQKTVERRYAGEDREIVATRKNSQGKPVFVVKATEDEMRQKESALISKVIRNEGLRLLPSDILEEAMILIDETLQTQAEKDPKAQVKKIVDAFHSVGVEVEDLEKYLGHSLSKVTPKEIVTMRETFTTIRDGQSTWADYIGQKNDKPKARKPKVGRPKGSKNRQKDDPSQSRPAEAKPNGTQEDLPID